MAIKDYEKHYDGMADPAGVIPTPNAVSRSPKVAERSFLTTVFQDGKPGLDSEVLLSQDAQQWNDYTLRRWQTSSGWLRGQTAYDSLADYTTGTAPGGVVAVFPGGSAAYIHADLTMVNTFILPKLEAIVAGLPVTVEYSNTSTADCNLIDLLAPTIYDGLAGTVKRTDFVFLEVWLALLAPSIKADGWVQVTGNAALAPLDTININVPPLPVLTAVAGAPAIDEFQIGGTAQITATNIAAAINNPVNSFATTVSAAVDLGATDTVIIRAVAPGTAGNLITLSITVAVPGALTVSGATLTGGEDRPSKPAADQTMLYRHGNVQSPAAVWLTDEIIDPTLQAESTQRVQIQYRIRTTGASEAVNYKIHPDGFSTASGGVPAIYAQGGGPTPVVDYPFVPADQTTVWANSSAVTFGIFDGGLWVAGDGTSTATEDLGTVDGYVYAIPICFVHRHNDCSDPAAALQGWEPLTNANGAPTYDHLLYVGSMGNIAPNVSDRPDDHFSDVIVQTNILDLRRHVLLTGLDTAKETQYQMQSLLDGSLRTWSVDTASKQKLGGSTGDVSVQHLICNEIGRTVPHGGVGPTDHGEFIREFDHVARRFGDQPVVERLVISFFPGDRVVGPVVFPGVANPGKYVTKVGGTPADTWWTGDVLHLDLANFDATTLGGIFQGLDGDGPSIVGGLTVSAVAPVGTVITDVLSIYHDEGDYAAAVDQTVKPTLIVGLGTPHVEITLDSNPTLSTGGMPAPPAVPYKMVGDTLLDVASTRRIFLEVEVTYPLGVGTTDTPDVQLVPDATLYDGSKVVGESPGPGALVTEDAVQRPADLEMQLAPRFREGYREVQLEYVANDTVSHAAPLPADPIGQNAPFEYIISRNMTDLYFPRRVFGHRDPVYVEDFPAAVVKVVDPAQTEYGSSSRKVVLTANLSGTGQTLCQIKYFAQDPIPNYGVLGGGFQVAVYFRANSPQTAGIKEGTLGTSETGVIPTVFNVEPLLMGADPWTIQVGPGSVDRGYPYTLPLDQIPTNDIGGPIVKDWYFCATTSISVADFNATTGQLSLHPFIQADGQNVLQMGGAAVPRKPVADAEFRAYYPFMANWVYRPSIMSQSLGGAVRHKVLFPFLARVVEEVHGSAGGILFRKNEVALVVLSRFAVLDDDNTIRFTDSSNTTCAAVYRTRNLLLITGEKFVSVPPEPGP